MNKLAKSMIVVGALAAAGQASADWMNDLCPYVGIDFKERWMKGDNDWENVFAKSYPGGDIFIGTRFNECVGLEIGYESTTKKGRDFAFSTGGTFFGQTVSSNITANSDVRLYGFYLDLNGYLPLENNFDLIGTVGIASMKPKVTINVSSGTGTVATQLASISGKTRAVWRLGVGAQYKMDMWGVRAILRWEDTSNLRVNGTNLVSNESKAFKDSTTLCIGVFLNF